MLGAGGVFALSLVLATAAYARVLGGEFQFDDTFAIERNLAIKDLAGYLRNHLVGASGAGRPIADLTFALNYQVSRLDPWAFHLTNVAIHLAVALLVWALGRRVARLAGAARPEWLAAAAAGVFAVHPLQSQAVSYVCQRAESLASGFYVATVLLLLEAERRGRTAAGALAFAGALGALVLGLGTKSIVVTAPAAYLVVGWAVSGAPAARSELARWRTRLVLASPFFALAALHAAAMLRATAGSLDAGFDTVGVTPGAYLLTQTRVVTTYLRLLAWPAGQNVDWDVSISRTLAEPAVLACGSILVTVVAGSIVLVRRARERADASACRSRLVGLGGLWFLLVLSVTSSVIPLADVLVEHRVYLASWGVFLAAAAAGEGLVERVPSSRRWIAAAALVLVLVALAIAVHRRNAVWETREALWRDAVAKSPDKPRPYLNLGWALRAAGRYPEAIALYRAGLERAKDNPDAELKLILNLGAALGYAGRGDEAIAMYRHGLEKAPELPELLINMGVALASKGDDAGAELWLGRAAAVNADDAWLLNTLGALRVRRGDARSGLPLLERAVSLDPDLPTARFNLGQALNGLGRREEACAAWREAISLGFDGPQRAVAERLVAERCR